MKTKLLALLALCGICVARDNGQGVEIGPAPPINGLYAALVGEKPDAAAIAKERHDRSQLAGEFRRKVEVLTSDEVATVKAILAKHPDKAVPAPAKPAPKP